MPLGTTPLRTEAAAVRCAGALRLAPRASPRPQRWAAVLLWLLLGVVLLAPLPLGSNRPLPASALAAAVGLLLCVWGVCALLAAAPTILPARPFWPAALLFGLAAAWVAAQAIPITPAALHHPLWSAAREALGGPHAGAISVNPAATWNRLMGLLAYAGIFWLALQTCGPRARSHEVLLALAAGGLLYAAYGIYDAFVADAGSVTSTFVNRNSFATYAAMTLLCGLGLVMREFAREARAGLSLRATAREMLARLDHRLALGVLTCLVAGSALLLTQSRGAFLALCSALAAFLWKLRRSASTTSATLSTAAAVAALCLLLGILALAGEGLLGRFTDADADALNRLAYYRTTWEAIWDRPLLGTGYGTYADAFRAYNHPGTGTWFLDKAHNTYLQIVMELGWPAAVALYSGLALLVLRALRGRGAEWQAVLASCSVLVAVHSLLDFSLEMPANAATYALLLGAGCAQALRTTGLRGGGRQISAS